MFIKNTTIFTQAIFAASILLSANIAAADLMEVVNIPDEDVLNLRAGPGSTYDKIGSVNEHELVEVLKFNPNNTWAQILHEGRIYWVAANYLNAPPRTTELPPSIGVNYVVGITDNDPDGGLLVRDGAGESFAHIGVLPNGSPVHVFQFDRSGSWAMIGYADGTGWVGSNYLSQSNTTVHESSDIMPDAENFPAVFTVVNTGDFDETKVFGSPINTSNLLGGLTLGAVVSINEVSPDGWGQITFNGQIGYVEMTQLARAAESSLTTVSNGFPLSLTCRGTEPYWSLYITPDREVRYVSLIDGPDPIKSITHTTPSPDGSYPFNFNAQHITGSIHEEACSDGMSDTTYLMSITLQRQNNASIIQTLHGCCSSP